MGIFQEHEAGAKCADLGRKHGISGTTVSVWKAKYSGMTVSAAKRLGALEDENARLKRPLVEQMLDMATMGSARREARGCRASEGLFRAVRAAGV